MTSYEEKVIHQDEMVAMYLQGATIEEIAKKFDTSFFVAKKIIKEKTELRERKVFTKDIEKACYDEFVAGADLKEIAKNHGFSLYTIKKSLNNTYGLNFSFGQELCRKVIHITEDYKAGLTVEQLGEKYSMSKVAIVNHLEQQQLL